MISGTRYRLTAEINRQADLAARLARLSTDLSSNKRIQAPSDDPLAYARLVDIRRAQADQVVWSNNVAASSALSENANVELGELATTLNRINELTLAAASQTASANDRATIAAELRTLADDIDAVALKRDVRGQPLFPTGTPILVPIGRGLSVPVAQSRDAVFGAVATPGGPRSLSDIVRDAAAAAEVADPIARRTATDAALGGVTAGTQHIISAIAVQGVYGRRLEDAAFALDSAALVLEGDRSLLEDVDRAATIAQINALDLTLSAAQAAFVRINRDTLFSKLG